MEQAFVNKKQWALTNPHRGYFVIKVWHKNTLKTRFKPIYILAQIFMDDAAALKVKKWTLDK